MAENHSDTTLHASSPLHFLMLPFPGQGHLNPMLAFAQNLVAQGCLVTCALPPQSHCAILESLSTAPPSPQRLRFAILPGDFPPMENWTDLLMAIPQRQGFLESLIEGSRSSHGATPISGLLADHAFPWAQDVANKCGIPCAVVWHCSAALFYIGCAARAAGGIHAEGPQLHAIQQKLHCMYSTRSILDVFDPVDPARKKIAESLFERVDEASHILLNNFEALEPLVVPLLLPKVFFIGPCLPPDMPSMVAPHASDSNQQVQQHHHAYSKTSFELAAGRLGNLTKEDVGCLSWLDEQEDYSVLFIAFGSVASLAPTEMVEIALGIEASKHKFLWVVRCSGAAGNDSKGGLPEGFLERTKGRGMVISWAPQLQVLNHRAVGGFFTHCGWNSTLESICMGVPMLCFPFFSDQPLNADTISAGVAHSSIPTTVSDDEHKDEAIVGVGLGFQGRQSAGVNSGYVVSREEVEREVRVLMGRRDGGVGEKLRENARQLMKQARHALDHQFGSSHAGLLSFIQDIRSLTPSLKPELSL